MLAFDAGTREVCTVKRSRTNTPLQALVLLNDVQFVEASRKLAERVMKLEADRDGRIAAAFKALAGRAPDRTEMRALRNLLNGEEEWFEQNPDAAAKLLELGDSEPIERIERGELAAMATVCNAILSLDASVWKR